MTARAADVFISYKAEDRPRLVSLIDALEAEGLSVWWDSHIGGGAHWREDIQEHLDAAKCVVVVWTKRSIGREGNFVRDEASRAQRRGVYLPILLDSVEPPLGFGEVQAISLSRWHRDRSDPRFLALVDAVRECISGDHVARDATHRERRSLSRRAVVAGAAGVGAAVVAGLGGWLMFKPAPANANRIAVLPFANLSGDPGQAYFADGIAEELRSALTRVGMQVIGRTSSDAVKDMDAKAAAAKLGVANILTGSVRRSPEAIRIDAQLVSGSDGVEKWAQSYDRTPGDAIKIQTDIAENVARALTAALGSAAHAAIAVGETQNADAHNLLLQALEAGNRTTQEDLERAFRLLDRAIALDPTYADAYAHKAGFLEFYADRFANTVPQLQTVRSEALQAAKTALHWAPALANAHRAIARIYLGELKFRPALAEFGRAMELAPGDGQLMADFALFQVRLGRSAAGVRNLVDRSIALDPLDPYSHRQRFLVLYYTRNYADAVRFTKELESKSPDLFIWQPQAGLAALLLGDLQGAQRYFDLSPKDHYWRLVGESALLVREGRAAEVNTKIVRLHELYGDTVAYQYAEIYAQLGDIDHAFSALRRAWEIRDSGLGWLKVDPLLDPLRVDQRFAELLSTLDFPS